MMELVTKGWTFPMIKGPAAYVLNELRLRVNNANEPVECEKIFEFSNLYYEELKLERVDKRGENHFTLYGWMMVNLKEAKPPYQRNLLERKRIIVEFDSDECFLVIPAIPENRCNHY